jgi:hypothetical protein
MRRSLIVFAVAVLSVTLVPALASAQEHSPSRYSPPRLIPFATPAQSGSSERAPCEKRVDGVLRTIGFSGRTGRLNISCRKAKRIMTRYILRKNLPGEWYCSHVGAAFGKCVDEKELFSEECAGREQRCVSSFNYAPGQRA